MRRGWFFVFLIVLFSTVLHIPITRSTETVRITTGHWPPYLDKDLPGGGFLARIIRESFALEGIEVRFSYFPWSRALALVHSPDYETSAVWSCTEDRSREFVFSAALIPYGWYFYYRAGQHFDWETLTDLQGMTVGLTQDYSCSIEAPPESQRGLLTANDPDVLALINRETPATISSRVTGV